MHRLVAGLALVSATLSPSGAYQVRTGHDEILAQVEPEMVRVPGGEFEMGLDAEELTDAVNACRAEIAEGEAVDQLCSRDQPLFRLAATGDKRRRIHLYDFDIDRLEVTTAAYRACVEAGGCDLTPLVAGDLRFIRDEWPIVSVTWHDAKRYCEWRGKRLPTEAEWEKAARGTDGRRWPWGNVDARDRANRGTFEPPELRSIYGYPGTTTDDSDGSKILVAPGTFHWGESPYGALDLAGNVSEWVADWHSETAYAGGTTLDPRGPATGTFRVVRGGGFDDPRLYARTYIRSRAFPNQRATSRGFRCARDVSRGSDDAAPSEMWYTGPAPEATE